MTIDADEWRSSGARSAAFAPSTTSDGVTRNFDRARDRRVQQRPPIHANELLGGSKTTGSARRQHDGVERRAFVLTALIRLSC